MSNTLLFPWIIIIETISLLLCISIAYSSSNTAIESAVGPHLLHIVTISVLLITFIKPSKEARSYARVYAWTNVLMDNLALFIMLFRYSQSEQLQLGDADTIHFILYIVTVLMLVSIDIHNVTFTWSDEAPILPHTAAPPAPPAAQVLPVPPVTPAQRSPLQKMFMQDRILAPRVHIPALPMFTQSARHPRLIKTT